MSFTDSLYLQTMESHKVVDKHPFVTLIRNNKEAGDMYVNFNKLCILEIQTVINIKDQNLYKRLHRDVIVPEIKESAAVAMPNLLKHCREYPLESAYQFYLGLLFGGSMLKKMLPEHQDFLTYEDNKELIQDFKQYLCDNVKEPEAFIKNVKKCYELIKVLFDEFYRELKYFP